MDVFQNDLIIRLKNGKDKYLIAEQDKESVTKCRDGLTKNAQWTVEVNDHESLYLKSCYGKYLTASNMPSIPGIVAKNLRVIQTLPEKRNTSHLWLPVNQSDSRDPLTLSLKTLHGTYLQANSGPPPLGNLITHDLLRKDGPNPVNKKILWQIEVVDAPSDQWKQSESTMSKMIVGVKSLMNEIHKDKEKNKNLKDEKGTTKGLNPLHVL
ncbi:uncharacterized protein LOC112511890 [Cynara cardunculus var. scolymus]|uniref:DUF569 domain-containing protein n=1 Tax=Cynara cardunculus var. scolymus TaxID=59895 RepID=A0A118K5G7_CYNCS|nr:uncharacterized protein LOC112511890 [Cynara cardunculus var. scolymus]KVI09075.1 hypothetical protein Ccrd_012485 [Cynara cardunculus var. scolymus]